MLKQRAGVQQHLLLCVLVRLVMPFWLVACTQVAVAFMACFVDM
jgi:hypothetical protein